MWVKGQSGNPNGKSKKHEEIRALCRRLADEGAERIGHIMKTTKDNKLALLCWSELANRGYGRPLQQIEATVNVFEQLGPELAARIAGTLAAAVASEETAAGGTDTRH